MKKYLSMPVNDEVHPEKSENDKFQSGGKFTVQTVTREERHFRSVLFLLPIFDALFNQEHIGYY